ncbi:MAG: OmpH family outer membrane protein [Prevotellaceae bacterium]|nr:OmpH family outer membrane protein [Prevotellaceae bacterium]
MRKISLTVIALAACLLVGCNKQKEVQTEAAAPANATAGLRIAYVEIDTLMANYQLCKDYTEIGNTEADNIKRTLDSKQRAFEQHYNSMQQKYQSNGFSSQEELDKAQASLQKEQQDLADLTDRLTNSFQEQQLEYNQIMRDSIQNFLKAYNKSKKFDLILSKAGDNILLANPQYDITNEVLKGLNKRYKPSQEVKEKLKSKTEAAADKK